MASTKRCKQFSENNNRYQDIAPRFKRQKSFNTNKPSTMESDNQNQHSSPFPRHKKSWGDSQSSNSGSQQHKGPSYPREGRKIMKKLSVQKAQAFAEKSHLKSQNQSFVLSPMENKLFNLMRDDDSDNLDSFGLDQNCDNNLQFPNNHLFVECPQNTALVPPSQQQHLSPSCARSTDSPHSTYSDPDIRTIEMLRELERVADQTDVGSEENNNDKNSLVSHHLRMLMCAVDRYTQGIDEEAGNDSCEEESLPSEEPQLIPSSLPEKPVNQGFYNNVYPSPTTPARAKHIQNAAAAPILTQQHMLSSWNLWSSPGFNGLDVYGFHEVPASPTMSYALVAPSNSMYFVDHGSYYTQESPFRL